MPLSYRMRSRLSGCKKTNAVFSSLSRPHPIQLSLSVQGTTVVDLEVLINESMAGRCPVPIDACSRTNWRLDTRDCGADEGKSAGIKGSRRSRCLDFAFALQTTNIVHLHLRTCSSPTSRILNYYHSCSPTTTIATTTPITDNPSNNRYNGLQTLRRSLLTICQEPTNLLPPLKGPPYLRLSHPGDC